MAGSRRGSSFLTWMSYVSTETYFILIKAYCFVGTQTLRNLSGDLSARMLESGYGWASKVSGQQNTWPMELLQNSKPAVNVCYVRLSYGVQTVVSVRPHEKIVPEAPGGRASGPFLQLVFGVWNAFIDTVVQVKCAPLQCGEDENFKAKRKKKIYQLVFTSLTLARSGCIRWPRVLGHGDQGAFLDHPVTCAEWLAKKPGRDEKTTSKIDLRALVCPAGSGSKI